MRPYVAIFAVVLASQSAAAAQDAPQQRPTAAPAAQPPAPVTSAADVARIKRRLDAGTPLLDSALTRPTFRASVTERVDIWRFWGAPDEVAAYVRPRGGTWHNEFQNMVTPDEFKGFGGGLGNGEKLQLAATSLAFASAMKLLGAGVLQAKEALHNRAVRKAKEEVQLELEAFYQLHPEARPAAAPRP